MVLILFLCILLKISHATQGSGEWPVRRSSFVDGDLILGGFFPIHGKDNDIMCGRLQDEGILDLEAMLYTVNRINNDSTILPNITLGVLAVDSCDSVLGAMQEGVEFAKGFIVRDDAKRNNMKNYSLFKCEDDSEPTYKDGRYNKVVAIIGGHSSWVSMQVADLMRIYKVPQVSYQSTNPALSDKTRYKYFFRTVPPLTHQVDAIFDLLRNFSWTYVSLVYADSEYGNKGFEFLKKHAQNQSICFSSLERINVENSKDENYDFVIKNLLSKNASAVIVFSDHELARNLMSAATRAQAFRRFVWIGSTAWVGRDYVTSGNEQTMEGALGISHDIEPLKNFGAYLKSITLEGHSEVNPWFPEYWEEKKKCKVRNFMDTPFNLNYTETCNPKAKLPLKSYLRTTPAVQFVRDAVHAVAQALHNLRNEKCRKSPGLCDEFLKAVGKDLREYIQKVQFQDEQEEIFHFNENGDGPPRYSVVNFQKVEGTNEYTWKKVGKYSYLHSEESHLELQNELMFFKHNETAFPESLCSARCKVGQAMIILDDDNCCWHCTNCTEFQYVSNGTSCQQCPLGTLPSFRRDTCEPVAVEYMDFTNPWAAACIVFSLMGIVMSLCVAGVFGKFWDTPIFIVSGRELSLILLTGIFLSFCLTFAIVSKPSDLSCGFTRFFLGFCCTISYAVIAAKTRHISRLSELQAANKKPKPINTESLWLIALSLIAVEGTINATWLIHSPPTTDFQYPSQMERVFICKGSDTAGYLVGLVFPFLLIIFCTVYAFNIRNFSGAFHESRYISFTNYTTLVVWLAFLPMFLLNKSSNLLRVIVLSVLLNVSALVQMVCLFLPKVYIALRRPEKNRHDNVMCYGERQSTHAVINE